jgi:D-3-phosphoglycerate dehydrogenase / 2-oxoglutarate reductase
MKILVISPIDSAALQELQRVHDVRCAFDIADEMALIPLIRDREVLIFRSGVHVTATVLAQAPEMRLLMRAGSGLDNLDMDYVARRGLSLVRFPGPGARAVAEMAFALMLILSRQVLVADSMLRQGRWIKNEVKGYLLANKTLGIVGAGNIGSQTGAMGALWGMEVLGCVENPSPTQEKALAAKGIQLASFSEVVERSDFLSLHVPLTNSTRHLIGREALSRMKAGSFLINLARGGVVDEDALYEALVTPGMLAGAALDVHREEGEGKISILAALPNVVLTPHIGATTVDSQREIGRQMVETVEEFAAVSVSFPETLSKNAVNSGE